MKILVLFTDRMVTNCLCTCRNLYTLRNERRIKLNNRIAILERRIQEESAAEVADMVRTANVTPEQLAILLRQAATMPPTPAALSAVGAEFDKEEINDEI